VLRRQLPVVQVMGWGRLSIERRPNRSGDAAAQVEVLEGERASRALRIYAEASRSGIAGSERVDELEHVVREVARTLSRGKHPISFTRPRLLDRASQQPAVDRCAGRARKLC
jgi:hypothetical protein